MYKYEDLKQEVLKEKNQKDFLRVRDNVDRLLSLSSVFIMEDAIKVVSGDNWTQMAYVDRLVELGEIREIPTDQSKASAQHRVFIRAVGGIK